MDIIFVFGTKVRGSSPLEGIRMPGHGHMKNKKFKIKKFLPKIILVFFFLSLAGQVLAICTGSLVPCGGEGNPCQFCHIFVLINNVISFILTCLAPIIAGLMLVIGGLYLLAAGPSPENVSKAKSVITSAVIGLVIIFVAWVFLNTFLDAIGVATWTGLMDNPDTPEVEGWWKIQCGTEAGGTGTGTGTGVPVIGVGAVLEGEILPPPNF